MSKRVAVSGAGGLVGSAVTRALQADGWQVQRLVRAAPRGDEEIRWGLERGQIESTKLKGLDAVIHLAGENIAAGRWTAARRAAIRDSRVEGTRRIAEALAALRQPPRTLINASAIGFYGDRGAEVLEESSAAGHGFLAETCVAWEAATVPAAAAGLRVVRLRIGVVLSGSGGALRRMLPPFKLGVGGRLGHGRQYWSWVALEDVVGAVRHALADEAVDGAVNVVAPNPVTNAEFTRELGRVLGRPTLLPVPGPLIEWLMGEMGRELLLASTRVVPRRLEASGFGFSLPGLGQALESCLS